MCRSAVARPGLETGRRRQERLLLASTGRAIRRSEDDRISNGPVSIAGQAPIRRTYAHRHFRSVDRGAIRFARFIAKRSHPVHDARKQRGRSGSAAARHVRMHGGRSRSRASASCGWAAWEIVGLLIRIEEAIDGLKVIRLPLAVAAHLCPAVRHSVTRNAPYRPGSTGPDPDAVAGVAATAGSVLARKRSRAIIPSGLVALNGNSPASKHDLALVLCKRMTMFSVPLAGPCSPIEGDNSRAVHRAGLFGGALVRGLALWPVELDLGAAREGSEALAVGRGVLVHAARIAITTASAAPTADRLRRAMAASYRTPHHYDTAVPGVVASFGETPNSTRLRQVRMYRG